MIGDRAFHRNGEVTAALAQALIVGLNEGGMGSVALQRKSSPIRMLRFQSTTHSETIWNDDVLSASTRAPAFRRHASHVIYPKVDPQPLWLQDVLRQRLAFRGVISATTLSMEGAAVAGGIVDRAQAAVLAGCDVVLVCNARRPIGQVVR